MSYSTVAGTASYFGSPNWNDKTIPSISDVTRWCNEASVLADAYLAGTVSVPVTDAKDLKIVQSVTDLYVIDCINFVLGKNRTPISNGTEVVARSISHKAFYEGLDRIKNKTILLISTLDSTISDSSYSGANGNGLAFVSAKDTVQW